MKNELIVARRTGHAKRAAAEHLREIAGQFGLDELLNTRFVLPPLPALS
jgi:hypothetical protein